MAENEHLEAFRVDPTLMGGIGAPPGAGAAPGGGAAPAPAPEKQDAGYPTIEGILSKRKHVEAFREAVKQSVQRLEAVATGGSGSRKAAGIDARRGQRHHDTA